MTDNWKKEMAHGPTKEYYKALKDLLNTDFIGILGVEIKSIYGIKKTPWNVLEIGVRTGISTHAFLESQSVKHLTSVDKDDCPLAALEVKDLDRIENWTFKKQWSMDFWANNKEKFDIIYVDGDHHEEPAAKDLQYAWEYLKEPGILMCDDVQHQKSFVGDSGYGVSRAWWGIMYGKKRRATYYPTKNGLAYIVK